MKYIKTLGIDLAKNVFQLHGVNSLGKCILKKRISRSKLAQYLANLSPCLIGIEACGSAHYWARTFQSMGHTVKLMAPKYVKRFLCTQKNDANDAAAICQAVLHPEMRFVPIKSIDQQDVLLIHRARELAIKNRTAQSNQMRGLLAEYGVIIPKGISQLRKNLMNLLEHFSDRLTDAANNLFIALYEQFKQFDVAVKKWDEQLSALAKADERCQALLAIEGIGEMTATALVATVGYGYDFKNGRELAAWLGMVPAQHSSGNKIRLLGISKRGDRYLRKLLIHGARSVVRACQTKMDKRSCWIKDKKERRGYNKAAVALANKNARIAWAMLTSGECYRKSQSLQLAA